MKNRKKLFLLTVAILSTFAIPAKAEMVKGEFTSLNIKQKTGIFQPYGENVSKKKVDFSTLVNYQGISNLSELKISTPVAIEISGKDENKLKVETLIVGKEDIYKNKLYRNDQIVENVEVDADPENPKYDFQT